MSVWWHQFKGQLLGIVGLHWIGAVVEKNSYQRHLLSIADIVQRRRAVQWSVAPFPALANSDVKHGNKKS